MTESSQQPGKFSAAERANEKFDLRAELNTIEECMNALKVLYEQYFSGILTQVPEQQHRQLRSLMRRVRKLPFRSSAINYRLRALETRYQTYNGYWLRVLREREEGTYWKDVFKANLHEEMAEEEARADTRQGRAEKQVKELFNAYKEALEKHTGKHQTLDFRKFHQNLVQSARDLKKKTGGRKVSFTVVVQGGKVKLKARVQDRS